MTSSNWKRLNGLFCIYKPAFKSMSQAKSRIISNLIKELDASHLQKIPEKYVKIEGSPHPRGPDMIVNVKDKLSTHPLALGSLYRPRDFKLSIANNLYHNSSGVCVLGINDASRYALFLKNQSIIKCYRLSGMFGKATTTSFQDARVLEKSTYDHVTYKRMCRILMVIQANHQKRAMESLGLDLQSKEAYDILSNSGLVRPASTEVSIIYSIKCIHFNPPDFTIEINCVNDDQHFLAHLIHDIGLLMRTNAVVTKIRCIRFGPFTVDHALLIKHWNLPYILDNINRLHDISTSIVPDSPSINEISDEYIEEEEQEML